MEVWVLILTAPFVWFLISRLISKSKSYPVEIYELPWLEIIILTIHYICFLRLFILIS